jgi:hypothetical protein
VKRFALYLAVIIIIYSILLVFFRHFLSLHEPIKSDVLVIEAWISPFEVEQALPLINSDSVAQIIIIGQRYPDNGEKVKSLTREFFDHTNSIQPKKNSGIWLLTNSALAFDCRQFSQVLLTDSLHISVTSKGTAALGYPAHFNLVINSHCVAGAFAETDFKEFIFHIPAPADGLQSLLIFFDNDVYHGKKEDRNLFISSLKINDTMFLAGTDNTFLIKEYFNYVSGFNSQAVEIWNYLVQLGAYPQKVRFIEFDPVKKNQTLAASLAFTHFCRYQNISSVNILSSGLHSRRTLITYKRILGNGTSVGVINFEPTGYLEGKRSNIISSFLYLNNEAFSYLYNWIVLTFRNL